MGFLIWCLFGFLFIGMGIYDFYSKKPKPFGFWANAKIVDIENVSGYNRALGKLWIVFGLVFLLLGLPLLAGQNSPLAVISIVGIFVESIVAMSVYTIKIEGKYRQKKSR